LQTTATSPEPRLRIRIVFGEDEMIGPGKADLLERIDHCGSIAAAGGATRVAALRALLKDIPGGK